MKTNVSIKFNSIEEYREIESKLIELGYKQHNKGIDDFMLDDLLNDLYVTFFERDKVYGVLDFVLKETEYLYNSLQEFLKENEKINFWNKVEQELACWVYYEDSHTFYCYDCVQKRVDEINTNKEFAEDINYEDGDTCGYMQDVADTGGEYEAECETCYKPLYTIGFPD